MLLIMSEGVGYMTSPPVIGFVVQSWGAGCPPQLKLRRAGWVHDFAKASSCEAGC